VGQPQELPHHLSSAGLSPLAMPPPATPAQRRLALRTFKQRGYVVQVGALEHVLDAYAEECGGGGDLALPSFLDRVLDALARAQARADDAAMLTANAAAAAVARVRADSDRAAGAPAAALELVDLFALPRWHGSAGRNGGVGGSEAEADASAGDASAPSPRLDAPPSAKARLFRTRYELILEKTLRNPRFTPPATRTLVSAAGAKSPYLQLTAIDSLQGSRGDKLVLGMLTQLEEGSWYLEDLNGSVQVALSEAHTTAGLHTDSSFVIVQGALVDQHSAEGDAVRPIFNVFAMGTPPQEQRSLSMQALGKDANLFGGSFDPSAHDSLLALQQGATDAMFLILSDVCLDNPRVT
jgi:DNA polymerase epsilon subunit 2